MRTPGGHGTATAIPSGRQQPHCPPGTLWEPGHDADRVPRSPRDTAGGIADRDFSVAPLNVSVLTIELSAVSPAHRFPLIYSDGSLFTSNTADLQGRSTLCFLIGTVACFGPEIATPRLDPEIR